VRRISQEFWEFCLNLPHQWVIGYARVSTYGQTLDAQLEQLRAAGCASRNIYREKVTGAHSDRRQLLKMLADLDAGDANVQLRSLAGPWADTGTSTGR
jgi:predicted site-specific integrase-resolvase